MSRSEKSATTGRRGWAWTDALLFLAALVFLAPLLYRLAEIAIEFAAR